VDDKRDGYALTSEKQCKTPGGFSVFIWTKQSHRQGGEPSVILLEWNSHEEKRFMHFTKKKRDFKQRAVSN
jgi:hypothetical protein